MNESPNYEVGDAIVYQTFDGSERTIRVTDKEEDIKNGRSGFDGHLLEDKSFTVWGYDSQIVQVLT